MTFRAAPIALAAAVLAALALPAAATSYVMVSDEHLVDTSTAVVEARVLSVEAAPTKNRPHTDYLIEVDRLLAGEVAGRNLVVRLPGGMGADGVGLQLYGVPRFGQGDRVLLFLDPREDGTYAVSDLLLGAFREVVRGGRLVAVRENLAAAHELGMPGDGAASRQRYSQPRAVEEFSRWIEERGRGRQPAAEYFLEPEPGREVDPFTLFGGRDARGNSSGFNMRWFEFQAGQPILWEIQSGGQPGYSQNATVNAFKTGMNAWNSESLSNVDYRYQSAAAPTTGNRDGHNTLIFDNVDDSIDSGDFTCTPGGGGTLAIGGPWYGLQAQGGPNGTSFHPILEAEITTNTGIECYLTAQANPQRALEQLLAHELGHTLGIGHSCPDEGPCNPTPSDALMYPYFHSDGRGAVLNSDDRNAVRYLYPAGPGGGGDPPVAPSGLVAVALSSNSVQLTWNDNSNDENGFVLQGAVAGEMLVDLVSLPANTSSRVVQGLDDDTLYQFRVRATSPNGPSAHSNLVSIQTLLGPPDAPGALVAVPVSPTSAALTWADGSDNESDFLVEARTPMNADDGWIAVKSGIVAVDDSPTVSTVVEGLATGLPYVFRVVARNPAGSSAPSNASAAKPTALVAPGPCDDSGGAICLLDDRFQVSVDWRRYDNGVSGSGEGAVFPGSNRSGTFWFFNPDNIELIVKVLDGSGLNDHYWTFYGALTDVEYWVTVVDTELGNSRTYYNPPQHQCGEFDTASLPASEQPVEGGSVAALPLAAVPMSVPARAIAAAEAGTCVADDTTLCLLDGRFAVTVDWVNQHAGGNTGVGHVAAGTGTSEKTGYFWFFNPANVELVVKALDGVPVNGYFWFFYGSLSDVEYRLTVTDTTSGQSRIYDNAPSNQCGQFDTTAFTAEGEVPEL